jgi:DNA-binding Lrp family transcriptional regulator
MTGWIWALSMPASSCRPGFARRCALCQHIGAEQQHHADSGSGSGSPTPLAWLRTRLRLEGDQFVQRNTHLGQLAEAGVDAVDGVASADDRLDDAPGRFHAGAGFGRDGDAVAVFGDLANLFQGQRLAVQFELGLLDPGCFQIQIHEVHDRNYFGYGTLQIHGTYAKIRRNRVNFSNMTIESTSLLDDYGRNLLQALQEDARLSYADLGRRVGLSPSATAERMRRMEEDGIIRAYTIEIDRDALGLPIMAYVRMTCEGQRYQPFLKFVHTLPEVRECHHVYGRRGFHFAGDDGFDCRVGANDRTAAALWDPDDEYCAFFAGGEAGL